MTHSKPGRSPLAVSIVALLVGLSAVLNVSGQAIAADPPTNADAILKPDSEPLDLEALKPGNTPAYLVTASSISLTQLTVPSLWWLREQIADQDAYGNKLLENWLAYPNSRRRPGRVDLVVNRQFWSLLDYLDRYAFIHVFGEAGRDYGYNVRVFDGQATLLGASTCDFSAIDIDAWQRRQASGPSESDRPASDVSQPPTDAIACSILLDSSGKGRLRGGSNPLPGAGAKALDTVQP